MALVSRRRLPIDRGYVDNSIANSTTAIPLTRNLTTFLPITNGNQQKNDGLLTLKYRNSIRNEDAQGTFGGFWEEKEIGCGGYGVVWVVRDPRNGKRMALKKMADVFRSWGHCKRAYRELRMLCSLRHENILTCCDILEPDEQFKDVFVLTELMETDLQRIITSTQTLTSDHIRIFMYQILRGMKYLHSANILHRDLKPSNLLVNANCFLKICDFGLARIWDEGDVDGQCLTQEVVTEYYRAPELLMGTSKYNASTDVWSIGCIFAELLARRILFCANGPFEQLNMIIDLLGTPTWSQMKYACDTARNHVIRLPYRSSNLIKLYSLSSQATTEAIDLLIQLLKFDPDERISVENAIEHSYVQDARLLYHSSLCACCGPVELGNFQNRANVFRMLKESLEPRRVQKLDASWEKELNNLTLWDIRRRIYDFIQGRLPIYGPLLTLNTTSITYDQFIAATVVEQTEPQPGCD